jgi:hypothetical protein
MGSAEAVTDELVDGRAKHDHDGKRYTQGKQGEAAWQKQQS